MKENNIEISFITNPPIPESFGSLRMFQTFNCSAPDVELCIYDEETESTRAREITIEDCPVEK